MRPYFEMDRVLRDGVLFAAQQLHGLTFRERKDLPTYQEDVRVFEVFNPDGSPTPRAQAAMGHTAMGRFGEAHELIGAAIFLASPKASSFVTGTDIRVDGGFLSQTI